MNKEILKKIEKIGGIPPMPEIASKVIRMVDDPRSTAKELEKLISLDPALSLKVLKMANSAFFGCMSTITNIQQAVVVMGLNTTKSLFIATSTSSLFSKRKDAVSEKMWEHSVGCGFASRLLAKNLKMPNADDLFTAGMLHDFGRVIIYNALCYEFGQIEDKVKDQDMSFYDAEQLVMGCNHTDIGLLLSEKWNLPDLLQDCIHFHHEPEKSINHKEAAHVVRLADMLCIKTGIGLQKNQSVNLENSLSASFLSIKKSDLESVNDEFVKLMDSAMSQFSL